MPINILKIDVLKPFLYTTNMPKTLNTIIKTDS